LAKQSQTSKASLAAKTRAPVLAQGRSRKKAKQANDKGQALVARAVQFGLRNRRGDAKLALALTFSF
jgi:hypothetical protein